MQSLPTKQLLDHIAFTEKRLEIKGYVFYPKSPSERLEEIKQYYSRTKLDLSDKGIKQALMSIAIDDVFVM